MNNSNSSSQQEEAKKMKKSGKNLHPSHKHNNNNSSSNVVNNTTNKNSGYSDGSAREARASSCRPPKGRTYLAIGQDLFSIQEYVTEAYNYSLHQYMYQQQLQQEMNNSSNSSNISSNSIHNHTDHLKKHPFWKQKKKPKKNPRSGGVLPLPPPSRSSVLPAAYMSYTDMETLKGLDRPVDYGSGIEYASGLAWDTPDKENSNSESYSGSNSGNNSEVEGWQVGLWLGGSTGCRSIVTGAWDSQLHRFFQYIISSSCPFRSIWVRVGYEFDNPGFGYQDDPALFRNAFIRIVQTYRQHHHHQQQQQQQRRVQTTTTTTTIDDHTNNNHDKIREEKNVWFVWHSWAAGGLPPDQTIQEYYPGTAYVDWIGISVFQQFYPDQPNTISEVLEFARLQNKPVMIAESTPFGGFDNILLQDPWNEWFEPILQLIQENNDIISMWSYINCNWESQPMWHNIGFGETRISQNTTIQQLWHEHVLHNPRFYIHKDGPLCSSSYHDDADHDELDNNDNHNDNHNEHARYNHHINYHTQRKHQQNQEDRHPQPRNQKNRSQLHHRRHHHHHAEKEEEENQKKHPSDTITINRNNENDDDDHDDKQRSMVRHKQHLPSVLSTWLTNYLLVPAIQPTTTTTTTITTFPSDTKVQQHQVRYHHQYPKPIPGGAAAATASYDSGVSSNPMVMTAVPTEDARFYSLSYYYWYAALLLMTVFWFVRYWLMQQQQHHHQHHHHHQSSTAAMAPTDDSSTSIMRRNHQDGNRNRNRRGGQQQQQQRRSWQQVALDHSPLFVKKLLSRIPEVSERSLEYDEQSSLTDHNNEEDETIVRSTRSLQHLDYGAVTPAAVINSHNNSHNNKQLYTYY